MRQILLVPLFVALQTSQVAEMFSVLDRTASIPDLRLNIIITFYLKSALHILLNLITRILNLL